ncbi:4'-phosphopantetheinyl transferase psf-1 [Leminorella richardii]|uniref:4'-phosphopantetheinyl transferase psf-1 n=1 Tax=Leminorella richardii TaxID=158841 RepID=A0A2X4VCC1_9GAMM|nr:4'-phosphopantetheinyl transferase superfamily protein [Leminorella richardii]SQI44442.1 4'-phosphopantetheinyl transferase psf-1 [Leminorella richardii]
MSQPPSLTLATVRLPDENWLPPSLARLSPSILTQSEAFTPQRRCQFLTGRWLLAELMHRQFGCDQLPEMGEPVNGRPSFASASLPDFNLSHSGTDLIVALAQGCRVGVDIEQNRPRKKLLALAQYSFSEEECLWLASLPESSQTDGFWQLWTLRESVLKLSAKGVWQMKQIAVSPSQRTVRTDFSPSPFCYIQRDNDVLWSAACDTPLSAEQISVWRIDADTLSFSPEPLTSMVTFAADGARR